MSVYWVVPMVQSLSIAPLKHKQFIDVNQFQNNLLTKEKNSVVESHHTHCSHWKGQRPRDLPPLPGRGVIHLSRGKVMIASNVRSTSDQQHLVPLNNELIHIQIVQNIVKLNVKREM